ncbi:hypothetical protein H6F32_01320 [Anabaena sp. FACHB-1237]|uniref:hypothetical protein n=1 Tax=Anabaena sp. FACHB-1237 TaxID=2692769 RepID=UPI001680285C|nr:hypothetical protein [Anabaena sp. FACHB-1237]MBD2136249.1 hypothetical protein [Anabaena sp. FACHB-1237]
MSLRGFLIASGLILSPLTTIGFQSAAFADTDNTHIQIGGTVATIISINATPTSDASNLPLSQTGEQIVKIADLKITTNSPAGVRITVKSLYNGTLLNDVNDYINYGIQITDDSTTPDSGSFKTLEEDVSISKTTGFNSETGEKQLDLYLRLNNLSIPKQGNYNDTITLTVADN